VVHALRVLVAEADHETLPRVVLPQNVVNLGLGSGNDLRRSEHTMVSSDLRGRVHQSHRIEVETRTQLANGLWRRQQERGEWREVREVKIERKARRNSDERGRKDLLTQAKGKHPLIITSNQETIPSTRGQSSHQPRSPNLGRSIDRISSTTTVKAN
jgi:hypothetical protein